VRTPDPCPAICSGEFQLPHHAVARIAALAVHADSSLLLDQVVLCADDERRDIIPHIWSNLKDSFICSRAWAPSYQITFGDEVQLIDPSISLGDAILTGLIAKTWSRIILLLGRLFSSSHCNSDQQTVWHRCVCDHAFEVPVHERVITMWIWILWSHNPLPFFLKQKLRSPPVVAGSCDATCLPVEARLMALQSLRSKRLVTKTEFMNKRQCILNSL
jgi:hypothetical protein